MDALKTNPQISWMGEVEYRLPLEKENVIYHGSPTVRIYTLKTNFLESCQVDGTYMLRHALLQAVYNGDVQVTDSDGKTLSEDDIYKITYYMDTIIVYDPETFQETVEVVRGGLEPHTIDEFAIKQLLYYNQTEQHMYALVQAIGVIQKRSETPVFWINMQQNPGLSYTFEKAAVTWAKRSIHTLQWDKIKTIKGDSKKVFREMIYDNIKSGKVKAYSSQRAIVGCQKALSMREFDQMCTGTVDTIITFSPETYKENIEVVKNEPITPDELNLLRFIQIWCYDTEQKQLASMLQSVAPMREIHDENGNYKYSLPLYYVDMSEQF